MAVVHRIDEPRNSPADSVAQGDAPHGGVGGSQNARGHFDVAVHLDLPAIEHLQRVRQLSRATSPKASAEAALVVARSISCVARNFGSACWAMTCFDTISMTLISGATWAMSPLDGHKPASEHGHRRGHIMFWPRSTSMTSVSTVPTLISFISAVLYSRAPRERLQPAPHGPPAPAHAQGPSPLPSADRRCRWPPP